MGFILAMQGSLNLMYYINIIRNKNHIVISTRIEKNVLDKIQQTFMKKTLNTQEQQNNLPQNNKNCILNAYR